MTNKMAYLAVILGGVIAGFSYSLVGDFPPVIISLAGGFLLGFSFMLFTSVYSGKVWGIKINRSGMGTLQITIGFIGLVIGGFSIVYTGLVLFTSLFAGEFGALLLNLAAFAAALAIGPFIAKIFLEKTLAKGTNAQVLGQIPLLKMIDADLAKATNFVVGFEGVALYSSTNYCYAVYLYEDYQLGTLTSPQEVALVGAYFVQKYSDKFTYKVDMEVIPGTPGQTVVAVGAGGIGIARINGTPDKRIFRSYIFKRR